jgi:hypothetical protein
MGLSRKPGVDIAELRPGTASLKIPKKISARRYTSPLKKFDFHRHNIVYYYKTNTHKGIP